MAELKRRVRDKWTFEYGFMVYHDGNVTLHLCLDRKLNRSLSSHTSHKGLRSAIDKAMVEHRKKGRRSTCHRERDLYPLSGRV